MSGDRHLRPDPEGRLRGGPPNLATVLVRAAPDYARSLPGQQLLHALVNLLARQYGVVETILLDVDDCAVHPAAFVPPHTADLTLVAALLALGQAVGDGLTVTRPWDATPPTCLISVGSGLDPTVLGVPGIAVAGCGWRAWSRSTGPLGEFEPDEVNPLGPHLAACIGAGFAFKSRVPSAAHGRPGSQPLERTGGRPSSP